MGWVTLGEEGGTYFLPAVDDGFIGMQSLERKGFDICGDYRGLLFGRGGIGRRGLLSERKALGDEVVVDEGKGAGGKEIDGDIQVSGISSAMGKCGVGEAMSWDVGESGGENGVFRGGKGRRCLVLVGVVITGACWCPACCCRSKDAKSLRCSH